MNDYGMVIISYKNTAQGMEGGHKGHFQPLAWRKCSIGNKR